MSRIWTRSQFCWEQRTTLGTLLPRSGFSWPVWRGTNRLALEDRHGSAILHAIFTSYGCCAATDDESVVDDALASLVSTAVEAMECTDLRDYDRQADFWRDFLGHWRTRRIGEVWFAGLQPDALFRFVVLVIQARQYALERWVRDLETEGSLARAVDGLVNMLECEYFGQWDVLDEYLGDVQGASHGDGGVM